MSDFVLHKDNVGDLYLIPDYIKEYVETLDNLISDTTGDLSLHEPLVSAWDEIMEKYRADVSA